MKTIAGIAACVAVLWTMAVSAESMKQPLPHATKTFEVPLLGPPDRAGIRIGCNSGNGTACTGFLDCRDQGVAPESLSGEVDLIPDQAVRVVTERDISDMAGAVDLTWPLHCEVRSTHPVRVQVLMRATSYWAWRGDGDQRNKVIPH